MSSKFNDLLPSIKSAGHTGLSFETLKKRFTGRSKGSVTQLRDALDVLVRKGTIRESSKGGKVEYHVVGGRAVAAEKQEKAPEKPPEKPDKAEKTPDRSKAAKHDAVLLALKDAADTGLTFPELKKRFAGKSGLTEPKLREELQSWVRKGEIRELIGGDKTEHYFVAGRGPSEHTVSAVVVRLALESGLTLSTAASLHESLTPLERGFLDKALEHALKAKALAELTVGATRCYLHREVAASCFVFEGKPAVPPAKVTLEDVLPVYRRLREEQGGFSGVKILDLMKVLNLPKEIIHPLLLEEAKAGRVTIHRSPSTELPREVTDAGIRLPNFPDPFVTFAVKKDR